MKAILVVGLKGSGKDTFAQPFLENGYKLGKFANLLKEATSLLAGYPKGFWETDAKNYPDRNGLSPREFITTISESLKKKYGRGIITKLTLPSIISSAGDSPLIFTDARFPVDEVIPVIEHFGRENVFIFKIHRSEVARKGLIHNLKRFLAKKGFSFKDSAYSPTEVFIDDIKPDVVIFNDFTLDHLHDVAESYIYHFKEDK